MTTITGNLSDYLANQAAATQKDNAASSSSSSDTITGNLTTFLKILTTQLQNQDPTNATDTNQFTQQLVMFAQAEQQINTNSKLDRMINLLNSNSLSSNLSYIGNYVEAASPSQQLALQGSKSEIAFDLASDASNLAVTVKDSNGKTVATLTGAGVKGTNYVAWDGKDSNGNTMPDGAYTFAVAASDSAGKTVEATNFKTLAKVEAIQTNDDGTTSLICGDLIVPDNQIDAIYAPGSLPAPNEQEDA